MAKRSFYVRESELDDYQTKVISRRTDNSFVVKGCAGSGKSILALWKVHEIITNKKGSVQMVVFTKALKSYMSTAMAEIGIDSHLVDYYWNWKRNGGHKYTKYLIVDEAQDFSKDDIDKFREAAEIVIFYGDSAQQLYASRSENPPISIEEIERYTGFSSEQLVFNYRLPNQIARVAQHILPSPDALEERCRNQGPEKPFFLRYDSHNQQLDAIYEIIMNRDLEDVGILFFKNNDVAEAARYLTRKGMKVEAKVRSDMDLNWSSTNPKLLTFHSAKGLQFEAVFIPDCDSVDPKYNNALYVAMTRTYQSLFILYTSALSPIFADIPKDLYETSLATKPTEEL